MTPSARSAYIRGLCGCGAAPMVEWAVERMLGGARSTALAVVAGANATDPNSAGEVRSYFLRALEDLGESPDPLDVEVLRYAAELAADVLTGTAHPRVVAREIARLALAPLSIEELMSWCGVEDEYDLAEQGIYGTLAHADESVRLLARTLVDRVKSLPPG